MRSALNPAVRRLIRRELAQNKGRTAILFLLTFLPLTFVLTIAIVTSARPIDTSDQQFGQADAFFMSSSGPPMSFAGNPRIVSWSERGLWFASTLLTVTDAPIGDPLLDGLGSGGTPWNDLAVDGRLPSAPGEVAVSANALGDLAPLMIDDDTLSWAPGELTIVGTLEGDSFDSLLVFAPGSIDASTITSFERDQPPLRGLIDWDGPVPADPAPFGFDQPEIGGAFVQWVGPGGFVQTRDGFHLASDPEPVVVSALFSLGLAIATGAIAFAAWGSSLRRRLRVVGVMASSGANRSHLTAIQAGQALLVAIAGAVVALVAAVAVVSLLPVSEMWLGEHEDSVLPIWSTVVAVLVPVVIAVTVATLAGWWPARQAGRIPLSALLAGRTPQTTRVPGGWIAGAGAVVFGLGLLAASVNVGPDGDSAVRTLLLGGVGLIAIALGSLPMLSTVFRRIGAPRIGAALPPVPRLVARNASRHTGRSAAAVLGIGAIVAAVWAGAVDAQEYRSSETTYQQDDHNTVLGPGSAAVIIGGGTPAERMERVERVMALIGGPIVGPHEALALEGPFGPTYRPDAQLASVVAGSIDQLFFVSAFRGAGDVRRPDLDLTVIGVPNGLTSTEADELDALAGVTTSAHRSVSIAPPTSDPELISQIVLLAIGFVVAAIVIAMVASVVASEVADDLRVVGLVGTTAGFRRRFLTTQTFLFSAAGVVGGLVMGTLIRLAVDDGVPIPWHVVVALAALPFVLAAGTALFTWRPSRANRRPDFGMASVAP